MLIILCVILVLSLFWTIHCIRLFVRKQKKNKAMSKEFVAWLEAKNDFDTLYKIGAYNKLGLKEERRTMGSLAALRAKYRETNDVEYKRVADLSIKQIWDSIFVFAGIYIGIVVFYGIARALFIRLTS